MSDMTLLVIEDRHFVWHDNISDRGSSICLTWPY